MKGLIERLAAHSSELLKRNDMYSGRDRIARGAIINVMITVILAVWYFANLHDANMVIISSAGGICMLTFCCFMWVEYEKRSHHHEIQSWFALQEFLQTKQDPPMEKHTNRNRHDSSRS